ncbi:MAG: HPF/RaiA family ribosome-associated protein [Cardiobacterium sp.]
MMNYNITGKHLDISDAVRSYVEEKLGKLEMQQITSTQITLRAALDELRPPETDPDPQHAVLWQQLLMITRTLEPCYQALASAQARRIPAARLASPMGEG